MNRPLPRISAVLAVLLALTLAVLPAEAGKKKKKKKKTQQQTTEVAAASDQAASGGQSDPAGQTSTSPAGGSEALRTVDRLLWAYDTKGARQALEGLAKEKDAAAALARARVLEQEKAYPEAAAELKACAEMAPGDPAPMIFLGETHLHAENMAAAQSAFAEGERRAKTLLAAQPGDAQALYYLGVAQQRQMKYGEAIETLNRARQAQPGNALVLFQLGLTHAFREDWPKAVEVLTEAINADSGIAYAYYYRGLSASKTGRKDLLINDLDRFLAMAPDSPEAPRARRIRDSA